jgi:hypothetical protein
VQRPARCKRPTSGAGPLPRLRARARALGAPAHSARPRSTTPPPPGPQGAARLVGRATNARMGARLALLPGAPPCMDAVLFEPAPASSPRPARAGSGSVLGSSSSGGLSRQGSLVPPTSDGSDPTGLAAVSAGALPSCGAGAGADGPQVLATPLPLQHSLLASAIAAGEARFIRDCSLYVQVRRAVWRSAGESSPYPVRPQRTRRLAPPCPAHPPPRL